MAEEAEVPTEEVKKKGKKGKLIPAVVLAIVVLGVGAKVTGLVGASKAKASGHGAVTTTTLAPEKTPGESITLDPQTISLVDGNYLKVAISLQLPEVAPKDAPFAKLAAAGPITPEAFKASYAAQALDETVSVMSHYSYDELSSPEGKAKAKVELATTIKKRYNDSVLDVYFTELVLQRA